ncbi:MAG: thioredoxin [Prevotella sp.]|nr:thioredoxin [Candidatus Prevotella equi]
MEVVITTDNFESYKSGDKLFVVDFWAEWCGPCKMIAPIISQLAQEYEGKVVIGKCNVEDCESIPAEYGIRNIPTLLFFKGGQLVDKFVGGANKAKLQERINANL